MANSSLKDKYFSLWKNLFPKGWAWVFVMENPLTKLLYALSEEPARIEERAFDFFDELDPSKTFEMLDRWETVLGLPDECSPKDYEPSKAERRGRVLQKLTTRGGQNKAYYKLIAKQLGYDVDVIDVVDFRPFRVGQARVGSPLSNTAGWGTTFMIKAPASLSRKFRVGQSTVGERLVTLQNDQLECVIAQRKQAHVTVLFSYED